MITTIILACLVTTASAVPVTPSIVPPQPAQGRDLPAQRVPSVEAANQKPEPQVLAQFQPSLLQPQPGVIQQLGPQGGPQFLPPLHHQPWVPQGGGPLIMALQPSVHGSHLANQPIQPQQPLILPPYGYFPVYSSQGNQLFSPYRFPVIVQAPPPQIPGNQPPTSPVTHGETPSGPIASGNEPNPTQQQQNPPIVYMFQQPMNSQLGGLSSEELQMAARMSRMGAYLPNIQTNMPAEATKPVSPISQAIGPVPANPGQPAFNLPSPVLLPTMGISSGGVTQTERLHPGLVSTGLPIPGTLPGTNNVPVGLERPGQDTTTVQAPVQPKHQLNKPGTLFLATPPPHISLDRESIPETVTLSNSDIYTP